VQFARQRVERLPELAVGEAEQRAVEAVGDPAARIERIVERVADGALVAAEAGNLRQFRLEAPRSRPCRCSRSTA
jgi:hypothetical protein